jgi:hypothetical protein
MRGRRELLSAAREASRVHFLALLDFDVPADHSAQPSGGDCQDVVEVLKNFHNGLS